MAERRPQYIESLTSLRGIAALWVVAFHFDIILGPLVSHETTGLFAKGYLWVDFFFVLSGFVICHVYGPWFSAGITRSAWQSYIVARFSRLYPLHLFSLLMVVLLYVTLKIFKPHVTRTFLGREWWNLEAIPIQLILGHSMDLTRKLSWNLASWSIAAEWWTYLCAIGLFRVLDTGLRWRAWVAAGLCMAGLHWLIAGSIRGSLDITYDDGFLRCLFEFTIGVCLYQAYKARLGTRVLGRDSCVLALGALILWLLHDRVYDLWLVPVFSLLILSAAYNRGRVRWLLERRPMRFLGDISYSIYMVHIFWVFVLWVGFVLRPRPTVAFGISQPMLAVCLLVLMAVVISSAWLTYRYIEVPSRQWLRQTLSR